MGPFLRFLSKHQNAILGLSAFAVGAVVVGLFLAYPPASMVISYLTGWLANAFSPLGVAAVPVATLLVSVTAAGLVVGVGAGIAHGATAISQLIDKHFGDDGKGTRVEGDAENPFGLESASRTQGFPPASLPQGGCRADATDGHSAAPTSFAP